MKILVIFEKKKGEIDMKTSDLEIVKFRRLLKKAMSTYETKGKFAQAAGISSGHLSRLLNGNGFARPSVATLKAIADASVGDVSFEALAACFELNNTEAAQVANMSSKRRSKYIVDLFSKGLPELCSTHPYDNIRSYLDTFDMIYGVWDVEYEVNDAVLLQGEYYDFCVNVVARWKDSESEICCGFLLFGYNTQNCGIIISDVKLDIPSLFAHNNPVAVEIHMLHEDEDGQEELKASQCFIATVTMQRLINRREVTDDMLELLGLDPRYVDKKKFLNQWLGLEEVVRQDAERCRLEEMQKDFFNDKE